MKSTDTIGADAFRIPSTRLDDDTVDPAARGTEINVHDGFESGSSGSFAKLKGYPPMASGAAAKLWRAHLAVPGEKKIARSEVSEAMVREVAHEVASLIETDYGVGVDADLLNIRLASPERAFQADIEMMGKAAGIDAQDWRDFVCPGGVFGALQREGIKRLVSYSNVETSSITIVPDNLPAKLNRDGLRRQVYLDLSNLAVLAKNPELNEAIHDARRVAVDRARNFGPKSQSALDALDTFAALSTMVNLGLGSKLQKGADIQGRFPSAPRRFASRAAQLTQLLSLLPVGRLDYNALGMMSAFDRAGDLAEIPQNALDVLMSQPSAVKLLLKTRGSVTVESESTDEGTQHQIVLAAKELCELNPHGSRLHVGFPEHFSSEAVAAFDSRTLSWEGG